MNKIGVNLRIDVSKLDKSRFYKGDKGTYCDLTVFIDPNNPDQYGQHGGIKQKKNKDENADLPFVGNATVFWKEGQQQAHNQGVQQAQQAVQQQPDEFIDDNIPFMNPYKFIEHCV